MRDGKKPTQPSAHQSRFESSFRFFCRTSSSARATASTVPSSSRKRKAPDNTNTVNDEVFSQPKTVEEIQKSVTRLQESGEKLVSKIDKLERLNDELLEFPEARGNKKVARVHASLNEFIANRRKLASKLPDVIGALEEVLARRRAQQQSEGASSLQTTDEQPRAAPSP